ncbi:uncharacterized protein BJX67DRAFT_332208 [Aspergillus lucknowensis]|uniref:Uncharacterized protein n=1 Tax=Aspergillus lucknowensis TaxID=176173 RepID=A0ABR4LY57_9EURO
MHMHVTPDNLFLDAVLRHATQQYARFPGRSNNPPPRLALQHLERLGVAPAFHSDKDRIPLYQEVLIGPQHPYYRLPQLRDLVALETQARFDTDAEGLRRELTIPSTIEKLSMAWSDATDFAFDKLCAVTRNLKQLSLQIPAAASLIGPGLHSRIFSVRAQFNDQLEHVDLYQGEFSAGKEVPDFDNNIMLCPPLPEFKRLLHLSIILYFLVGHACDHPSPFKLRSHLPPNLESLGLYTDNATNAMRFIADLDAELQNLIIRSAERHTLCSVYLDGRQIEREAADEYGVKLRDSELYYFFYGGAYTRVGDILALWFRRLHDGLKRRARVVIPRGMVVHDVQGEMVPQQEFAQRALKRARLMS